MFRSIAPFSTSTLQSVEPYFHLGRRQQGKCGPSANGASCGPNLCCSPAGLCGTGNTYCGAPGCLFPYGPACDANQNPSGKDTASILRPNVGSLPYGVEIRHCTAPGKVAITFDDGPWTFTSDLLDLLKKNNIKSTFFIVGNNLSKGHINDPATGYPALIQRMHADGHQIASHSWSHQDLSTLTSQQRRDQVIKNEIALSDILGFIPTYFRPPYMSCNSDCMHDLGALGYHVVNYDIDTLDWQENYPNSQKIFLGALSGGKPSSSSFLPLTHDIHNGTVHGLVQFMIDNLRQQGFTTATVGECLADPPSNWYRETSNGTSSSNQVTPPAKTSSSSIASTGAVKAVSTFSNGSTAQATPYGTTAVAATTTLGSPAHSSSTSSTSRGKRRHGQSSSRYLTGFLVAVGLWSLMT